MKESAASRRPATTSTTTERTTTTTKVNPVNVTTNQPSVSRKGLKVLSSCYGSNSTMFAGLLITGGEGARKSVELLEVKGFQGCEINDLPEGRDYHTQV